MKVKAEVKVQQVNRLYSALAQPKPARFHSPRPRRAPTSILNSPSTLVLPNRHEQLLPLVAEKFSPFTDLEAFDRDVHDPRSV